jgi:hypothetical protein
MKKEQRVRMFQNRVQKRTFEPKRDVVTGEWRRGALLSVCLTNIIWVIKS